MAKDFSGMDLCLSCNGAPLRISFDVQNMLAFWDACVSEMNPEECKGRLGIMLRIKTSSPAFRFKLNAASFPSTQITMVCHISAGRYPGGGGLARPTSTSDGGDTRWVGTAISTGQGGSHLLVWHNPFPVLWLHTFVSICPGMGPLIMCFCLGCAPAVFFGYAFILDAFRMLYFGYVWIRSLCFRIQNGTFWIRFMDTRTLDFGYAFFCFGYVFFLFWIRQDTCYFLTPLVWNSNIVTFFWIRLSEMS